MDRLTSDKYFKIDQTTWNDLDMDEIIKELDICRSSAGHDYLKDSLHRLILDRQILKERSLRAAYLEGSGKSLTLRLQKIFSGLGVTKKYSFREHIFRLEEAQAQSNIKHYIMALLLIAAIVMIFIKPLIGIIAIVAMFAVNISTYFSDRSRIEAYFICVKYLASMVICAQKVSQLPFSGTPFEEYREDLIRLSKTFAPIKRGSWLITNSVSGSLVDVIMDYIRMLFHVDLIKFNSMRKTAMDHKDEIDELYSILGEIELDMCIASYRERLTLYCEPSFTEKCRAVFTDIRHPLITDPVGNSLESERSVLLTGSNASGKSTFLKSAAICQIFAQTIYTCPAQDYRTDFFKVISSMALTDNLLNNESYFIVEIKSLKRIFDELGDVPVLCFVDEVLRGTNTKERIAASTVILKSLSQKNAFVFAATHDIELTELLSEYMENYHFSETVTDTVTFDYKIKKGPSVSRNAIKLLDMYGFGKEIVKEAEKLAEDQV